MFDLPPRYVHHLKAVSKKYAISPDRIMEFGTGGTLIVAARMEFAWRLCIVEELGWSPAAHHLNVDHSSLMYLARKYSRERFGSPEKPSLDRLIRTTFHRATEEVEAIRWKSDQQVFA